MAGPESLESPPEHDTSTKVNVRAHAAKLGLKSKQVSVFVHLSGHELNFWLQIPEIITTFCVTRTQRRRAKIARVWGKWCLGPRQRQEIPGDVFNKAGQRRRRRPEDRRLKTYWSGALCQKSEAAVGCWLSEFDQEWDMHILQVDWWKKKECQGDFSQCAQTEMCQTRIFFLCCHHLQLSKSVLRETEFTRAHTYLTSLWVTLATEAHSTPWVNLYVQSFGLWDSYLVCGEIYR